MSHLRRHSLWDLKTKELEVEPEWVLNTPRRRQSFVESDVGFNNLTFGQYDEDGITKHYLERPESDSEAEFTDSDENEYSLADTESNDSDGLTPEFSFLKRLFCPDPNSDLVDWDLFSAGLRKISPDFYTNQLVSVFKRVSPQKQPARFSEFMNFFKNPCDDPLIEFHRKQMYNSILQAFKAHKSSSNKANVMDHEESSEEVDDFEDESIDTLRKRCRDQYERIQDLEVEMERHATEYVKVMGRCRHLEKNISLLKDGEKLHTHVLLLQAMIRNRQDVKSKRLRIMPAGATVRICEIKGNRGRLDFPIKGWCSVFAQDGRPILQSLNAEEPVPAPQLFLERQESESESLRPSVKRGHEEQRERSEREFDEKQHEDLLLRIQALELALEEVARSKILLIQSTSCEIDRLSHLIVE